MTTRTTDPPADSEGEGFDSLLRRLRSIVEQLERDEMSLEDSLESFETGMELSNKGQQILDAAERRVEVLIKGNLQQLDE